MINSDMPLKKASDDLLNRGAFARNIANAILEYSSSISFSIGLYGAWGTGKSSLLNMIVENVQKDEDKPIVLQFNPWLCSEPKQMISQFFLQLAAEIKLTKPSYKIWKMIGKYGSLLDATSLIPTYGQFIAGAGKMITASARMKTSLDEGNIQKTKKEIIDKLSEKKIRILVTIDDIDRLTKEEIIAVFQLIKSLADFPNTVYLLAFDYEVVVNALSKVQDGDGRAYLEKIIQVPFKIPEPDMEDIYNVLSDRLNRILADCPPQNWESDMWGHLFHFGIKHYIQNLRDVTRFTNAYYLIHQLINKDTNQVDLLGITCLQVFEPILHSKLFIYKETICGTEWFVEKETRMQECKEAINSLLDSSSTSNSIAAKNILATLFPTIKEALGLYGLSRRNSKADLQHNMNVASPECFDRYFSFALEKSAISAPALSFIINEANETELLNELALYAKSKKIKYILDELHTRAEKQLITVPRVPMLLECLLIQWDSFALDDGFLSLPSSWRLVSLMKKLIGALPVSERKEIIESFFSNQRISLRVLSILLNNFEREHGRFTEEPAEIATLPIDTLLTIEEVFKKRAKEELEKWPTNCREEGLSFEYMLSCLDPDYCEKKKKDLVVDNQSFLTVLDYCTKHATQTFPVVTKTWSLMEDSLGEYIDKNKALALASAIIKSEEFKDLDEEDQYNLGLLLLYFEKKETTNSDDVMYYKGQIEKAIERYREG